MVQVSARQLMEVIGVLINALSGLKQKRTIKNGNFGVAKSQAIKAPHGPMPKSH